jgi:hypothetical protein
MRANQNNRSPTVTHFTESVLFMTNEANKVFLIAAPAAAMSASGLTRIDFSDGYSGQGDRTYVDAEQAGRAVFAEPHRMLTWLIILRNGIVAPLGLKKSISFSDRGLGKIGMFPIISSTGTEVVVGGDDKHLDFRIWISIQPSLKGSEVTISTLVKINNLFGRVYLFIIMPFHKLLTRSLLERAVNRRDKVHRKPER